MKPLQLENRLIDFSVALLELSEYLPNDFASNHLYKQLIRSSTSAALNYGEAQAAESRADFIHKMKVANKELKETHVCLKILYRWNRLSELNSAVAIKECNDLISIFVASLKTAKANASKI